MLLTTCYMSRLKIVMCALLACVLQGKLAAGNCTLDVPVYDARGFPLPFRIAEVVTDDSGPVVQLAGKRIDGMLTTIVGHRVLFSSDRIIGKRAIRVVLEGPKGARISSRLFVTSCTQRHSLVFGEQDSGLDAAYVTIVGQLSGCAFSDEWWLRTIGMFGGHDGMVAEEGSIQTDGSFGIPIASTGVRRIVVIGKARTPVKSVAVDVVSGRPVELGRIDLSGACPP